jgi:hypothetical protein
VSKPLGYYERRAHMLKTGYFSPSWTNVVSFFSAQQLLATYDMCIYLPHLGRSVFLKKDGMDGMGIIVKNMEQLVRPFEKYKYRITKKKTEGLFCVTWEPFVSLTCMSSERENRGCVILKKGL